MCYSSDKCTRAHLHIAATEEHRTYKATVDESQQHARRSSITTTIMCSDDNHSTANILLDVILVSSHLESVIVTMEAMKRKYLPINGVPTELGGKKTKNRKKNTNNKTR